jgi:hypothetical protein
MQFKTGVLLLRPVFRMTPTTAAELEALTTYELLTLFHELDAPEVEEMHGDYDARLLSQPSRFAQFTGYLSVGTPLMPWRSKGFRPVTESRGRGYNSFAPLGRVIQRYPMATQLTPSRYDGRPAYTLIYAAYRSTCGAVNMVDEVRRLQDGLYLAIGTWGYTDRQRRTPLPFVLEHTGRPYLGDLGTQRPNFTPGAREIPALTSAPDYALSAEESA